MKPFAGVPVEYIEAFRNIVNKYNEWFVDALKIDNILKFKCVDNQTSLKFIEACINKKIDEFELSHGYHVKDVLKRMLNVSFEKCDYKRKSK